MSSGAKTIIGVLVALVILEFGFIVFQEYSYYKETGNFGFVSVLGGVSPEHSSDQGLPPTLPADTDTLGLDNADSLGGFDEPALSDQIPQFTDDASLKGDFSFVPEEYQAELDAASYSSFSYERVTPGDDGFSLSYREVMSLAEICGEEGCFDQSYVTCTPASMFVDSNRRNRVEIIGPEAGLCRVEVTHFGVLYDGVPSVSSCLYDTVVNWFEAEDAVFHSDGTLDPSAACSGTYFDALAERTVVSQ